MQVVPTLLGILTGVYLCAATYHLCIAIQKKQTGIHLSFSVICLMAAGYCLTAKSVYSALSIPPFLYALKLQFSFGIVFMSGVIWFTVYFTNSTSRVIPISLSICAVGLVALNQLLPGGILFSGVNNFDYLKLPWGEQIAFPDTDVSQWIFTLWSYYLAAFVYVFVRCYRLWQSGLTRAAIVFGINIISLLLVTIFDISVDLRLISSMYLSEFRFLPCVLSMAIYTSKN